MPEALGLTTDAWVKQLVAARIANLSPGNPQFRQLAELEPVTQQDAADMLNVGRRTVERAREVIGQGTSELVAAVERGQISVSAASEATELDPDVQRELVERVEAGEKASEVIREKKAHVSNNSGNNEWYTPEPFIVAARAAMGTIDLDPASTAIANKVIAAPLQNYARMVTASARSRQWLGWIRRLFITT